MSKAKKLLGLLVLCVLLSIRANAQIKITDNFADGDFTKNPAWTGNAADFAVASGQLQLSASASGKSYLSTAAAWQDTASWECYAKLDFSPSTSNQLRLYLSFSNADLSGSGNGYLLRIGQSGNDDNLEFCKQSGTTITKLAEGTLGTMSHASNEVRIKVTRSKKGEFEVMADFTGGSSFTTDFKVTDQSFSDGAYFGFYCIYTSTRADKFYFDDVNIGPIYKDTKAPDLLSAEVLDQTHIKLKFSEPLDSVSARKTDNYAVNAAMPIAANYSHKEPDAVILTVSPLVSGNSYKIEVSQVKDLAGNAMTQASKTVSFFKASYSDVIINEFFPDPTPVVGLPDAEFVELYNRTKVAIDLTNWTITDGTSTGKLAAYTLPAGEYLVLCASSRVADFQVFGNVLGVSLPSLNNSGDKLVLKAADGTLIDKLQYDLSWYHDGSKTDGGYTLERINPDLVCTGPNNWAASTDASGGTPGRKNAIYNNAPDVTAPQLQDALAASPQKVTLSFDEPVDSASVLSATFELIGYSGTLKAQSDLVDKTMVQLSLSQALDANVYYDLKISGIKDCEGNILSQTYAQKVIYLKPKLPDLHDLIITEIFADPEPVYDLPATEYIEIYNTTDSPLYVGNVYFSDGSDSTQLPDVILLPHEYVVLTKNTEAYLFEPFGKTFGLSGMPGLNNGGELLSLKTKWGKTLHFVHYSDLWYGNDNKKGGGYSLEMIDVDNPCGRQDNWTGAKNNVYGTPGKENSVAAANPDNSAPALLNAIALDSVSVFLQLSEIVDSATLLNTGNYKIADFAAQMLQAKYSDIELTSTVLKLSKPLEKNVLYELSANKITDCVGNVMQENALQFALPDVLDSFDVVVNEVLFNPIGNGADFVEIYNRSEKYIDLSHLLIATLDSRGDLSNIAPLSEKSYLLKPHSYLAFTEDIANIETAYFVKAPDKLLYANLPSLGNTDGEVVLLRNDTTVIDQLVYSNKWHYPLLENEDGFSLERINPDGETQNSSNWHTASSASGGATPTYVNSQYASELPGENAIELSSESFSPDNDGYQDFLQITINSKSQNQTAAISIFDLNGQRIKTLAGNDILGRVSQYQWDGFDEQGAKAPIGVYIILFEIVDLDGGKAQNIKKSVVVAGKL
ncbi:hypothetical protein GC194_02360 [bacterium]|nr:hypothetical protein [bacterium]